MEKSLKIKKIIVRSEISGLSGLSTSTFPYALVDTRAVIGKIIFQDDSIIAKAVILLAEFLGKKDDNWEVTQVQSLVWSKSEFELEVLEDLNEEVQAHLIDDGKLVYKIEPPETPQPSNGGIPMGVPPIARSCGMNDESMFG